MDKDLKIITADSPFLRIGRWISALTVRQKVSFIATMAQVLALVAIGAGLAGMIFTNNSIRSMYSDSIMPLEHLRATKFAIEYDTIQIAKDLKEGKMSSDASGGMQTVDDIYKTALMRVEKAEKDIRLHWGKYAASKELTAVERQKVPQINESMQKALASITDLRNIIGKKDLPALMDYVESEMPFMLSNMTQPLDELMQLQVKRSHAM